MTKQGNVGFSAAYGPDGRLLIASELMFHYHASNSVISATYSTGGTCCRRCEGLSVAEPYHTEVTECSDVTQL